MANIAEINSSNFKNEVVDKEGVTVVRFWATWCPPCTRMKPVYHELAGDMDGQAKFGEIDIDKAPDIANALGIRSVPTVVVFKDGKPVDGLVGAGAKSQLAEKITAHL